MVKDEDCLNGEEDDQDADGKEGKAGNNERYLKYTRPGCIDGLFELIQR